VPIVAQDQFHALASQEGVTLSLAESAVVLRVLKPPVNLVLTVPDNVFEWFVSVSNSETGGTVEDWVDHYGAPGAQLQAEMSSEVLSFARNLLDRPLRFSETQGKTVLEWRIGDDWCQCVPLEQGNEY
jgi:hypothetical protein